VSANSWSKRSVQSPRGESIRGVRELARIRGAIREAREETFARSAAEQPGGGRLTDLVSYEARIAAVAEWPIDTSTLLRLGFYLAIGLGSWVGAAMVERLLETALG
jgi:hypothetical protein